MTRVRRISRAVVEEVHAEYGGEARRAANGFLRRHRPRNPEDVHGEAGVLFCEALLRYDEARGDFGPWVRYYVGKNLTEQARTLARRPVTVPLPHALSCAPGFNLARFLAELGPDACLVVRLALGGTTGTAGGKGGRSLLRRRLREWGWGLERIMESFREITDALT
jgi:hypothetical protein